jgi:hypothetical protein
MSATKTTLDDKGIALGLSVPPFTPHAISVSLPKWNDNVGYEKGEKRVVDAMVSGYPRFFIHLSIEKVCSGNFYTSSAPDCNLNFSLLGYVNKNLVSSVNAVYCFLRKLPQTTAALSSWGVCHKQDPPFPSALPNISSAEKTTRGMKPIQPAVIMGLHHHRPLLSFTSYFSLQTPCRLRGSSGSTQEWEYRVALQITVYL